MSCVYRNRKGMIINVMGTEIYIIITIHNNIQDHIYTSAIIYGAKPYARVHFGSSERKSVSARWWQTRSQAANLTFESPVGCYMPNIHPYCYSTMRLILIYCALDNRALTLANANRQFRENEGKNRGQVKSTFADGRTTGLKRQGIEGCGLFTK